MLPLAHRDCSYRAAGLILSSILITCCEVTQVIRLIPSSRLCFQLQSLKKGIASSVRVTPGARMKYHIHVARESRMFCRSSLSRNWPQFKCRQVPVFALASIRSKGVIGWFPTRRFRVFSGIHHVVQIVWLQFSKKGRPSFSDFPERMSYTFTRKCHRRRLPLAFSSPFIARHIYLAPMSQSQLRLTVQTSGIHCKLNHTLTKCSHTMQPWLSVSFRWFTRGCHFWPAAVPRDLDVHYHIIYVLF